MTGMPRQRLEAVAFAARVVPILAPTTLALEAGPRTIALGPNGAGKSALLRLRHALLAPVSGGVRWPGSGAAATAEHRAMVFQRPVMLRRSMLANVTYALALRRRTAP
jgi:tungstate transport system ATP-binding protein